MLWAEFALFLWRFVSFVQYPFVFCMGNVLFTLSVEGLFWLTWCHCWCYYNAFLCLRAFLYYALQCPCVNLVWLIYTRAQAFSACWIASRCSQMVIPTCLCRMSKHTTPLMTSESLVCYRCACGCVMVPLSHIMVFFSTGIVCTF